MANTVYGVSVFEGVGIHSVYICVYMYMLDFLAIVYNLCY